MYIDAFLLSLYWIRFFGVDDKSTQAYPSSKRPDCEKSHHNRTLATASLAHVPEPCVSADSSSPPTSQD